MIICVDRSSRGLLFLHVSVDLWPCYTNPELITVLRMAAEQMGRSKVSEEPIASGAHPLIKEMGELEISARQRGNPFERSDLLFAGLFTGCLFLGVLFMAMLAARCSGQGENDRAVQHFLPGVEVGKRFCAPCGGGVGVEVQYRRIAHAKYLCLK